MKRSETTPRALVTVDVGGNVMTAEVYTDEGFDLLTKLWVKVATERRLNYEQTWMGTPIIQHPSDIVAIQELLWKIRPQLVIETGIAHGGSLLLTASILELIGTGGVIGIDIDIRSEVRTMLEMHPLAHRIKLIEGSSVGGATVAAVNEAAVNTATCLVVLDSCHDKEHVREEMELYAPLVSVGSYMVVHDGSQAWVWDIPRGNHSWKDNNPLAAIHSFLEDHTEFIVDMDMTRYGITSSPDGWLLRVGE